MNDEYVVWLLIAALAGVAALMWFLYGRLPREEDDVARDEMAAEATWISDTLAEGGTRLDPDSVEQVIRLHRRYLAGVVPPREPGDPGWPAPEEDAVEAEPEPVPAAGRERSAGHSAPVERDRTRRESPEADIRQPG